MKKLIIILTFGAVMANAYAQSQIKGYGSKPKAGDVIHGIVMDPEGPVKAVDIFEVNENDTSKYTSRVERWYKMFSFKDLKEIKAKGDDFGYKTAKSVTLKGIPQRFMTKTGRIFCHIITGRKNTYNH